MGRQSFRELIALTTATIVRITSNPSVLYTLLLLERSKVKIRIMRTIQRDLYTILTMRLIFIFDMVIVAQSVPDPPKRRKLDHPARSQHPELYCRLHK